MQDAHKSEQPMTPPQLPVQGAASTPKPENGVELPLGKEFETWPRTVPLGPNRVIVTVTVPVASKQTET